jgi:MFS family permease
MTATIKSPGAFALLGKTTFAPIFWTQFLGTFNDNFFKNAVVFGMVYNVLKLTDADPKLVITFAAGIFILPFFLFSVLGGQFADKYDKDKIIRFVKMAEILIACLGAVGLFLQSMPILLFVLFLFGVQSALFGPSKLAILPQLLPTEQLISGNGLMSAGNFVAILVGTICGGLVITSPALGVPGASIAMLVCAVLGYIAARCIPGAKSATPALKVNWNIPQEIFRNFSYSMKQKQGVFLSILGIGWFYFVGGTFLAQFPNYAKENLSADEYVLTFFLVLFTVGVAIGAIVNNALLKGRIEATYVPISILGISVFAMDLSLLDLSAFAHSHALQDIGTFFGTITAWRLSLDLFFMAFFAGLFVVPLTAFIQEAPPVNYKAIDPWQTQIYQE